MRINDLYILTTPEFEEEFRDRGEVIVPSAPKDVKAPPNGEAVGRMGRDKLTGGKKLDRRRCRKA